MSCTTKTPGNQSESVWGSVRMYLCLFIWEIAKGKASLFQVGFAWGQGNISQQGLEWKHAFTFFPLDSLIRAMAITYILNRAIHSIILRNRKSHLSNSFLQMSEIKINQSIFWLGWLTISATLLQNRLPLTHTYSKVLRFNLNIWSLIVGTQAKLQTAWNLQYLFMQQTLPYQFCTFFLLWALILQYVPNYTLNLFLDVLSTVFPN